jgi:small subunit ribosomal protein S8
MNIVDPIGDYLTRVRNAIAARHKRVDIPASNLKREITKILSTQHFIQGFTEISDNQQGILRLSLRYSDGVNAITGLSRISKPGLRVYVSSDEIPRVLNGLGIAIISTSKGLMTDKNARQEKIGGEVLCHIW